MPTFRLLWGIRLLLVSKDFICFSCQFTHALEEKVSSYKIFYSTFFWGVNVYYATGRFFLRHLFCHYTEPGKRALTTQHLT